MLNDQKIKGLFIVRQFLSLRQRFNPKEKIWSTIKKNTAAKVVMINTITAPVRVSRVVGQVTLLPSFLTSCMNLIGFIIF